MVAHFCGNYVTDNYYVEGATLSASASTSSTWERELDCIEELIQSGSLLYVMDGGEHQGEGFSCQIFENNNNQRGLLNDGLSAEVDSRPHLNILQRTDERRRRRSKVELNSRNVN